MGDAEYTLLDCSGAPVFAFTDRVSRLLFSGWGGRACAARPQEALHLGQK